MATQAQEKEAAARAKRYVEELVFPRVVEPFIKKHASDSKLMEAALTHLIEESMRGYWIGYIEAIDQLGGVTPDHIRRLGKFLIANAKCKA